MTATDVAPDVGGPEPRGAGGSDREHRAFHPTIDPSPQRASAGPARGVRISMTGVRMEHRTSRGSVVALDDVTFSIPAGSNLAVIGRSGSGKSTLLGLIGGLELPTAGHVRVGDYVVSHMSDRRRALLRRRHFGFVFQADNLQPFLTVAENVGLQSVMARGADAQERALELLSALGLAGLEHRFPHQLSGGQRQRVAVARALVHDPGVVLADEPTGALDPDSALRVTELLLRLHRRSGSTLVVVTHDPRVAARMDSVMAVRAGRLAGPPERLR